MNKKIELGSLPKNVKLPPRKIDSSKIKLPPKRNTAVLPVLDGKHCKCPYCGEMFVWPPKELKCPSCSATVQPPPGFGPADKDRRRMLKEKILEARDRELKRMGERRGSLPQNRATVGIMLIVMFILGFGLIASSERKTSSSSRLTADERHYISATNNISILCMALEHFKTDCGHYPNTDPNGECGLLSLMEDLGTEGWCGPYASGLDSDGWHRPFFYQCTNGVPELRSYGPDRLPNTEDDIVSDLNQFQCHPDFVPHRKRSQLRRPVVHIGQ